MYSRITKAVFPTAYLPPIEYFISFLLTENVLIEAYETYPKQTYRNRCYIYSSNGVESLHIPVIKPHGNRSKTNEVLISYTQPWQRNHWRTICSAYSKAPFFIYYKDFLESFYNEKKIDKLLDFNSLILKDLFMEIGFEMNIKFTEDFVKKIDAGIDFRNIINPKLKDDKLLKFKNQPIYSQVFEYKHGFKYNLSIIDLIFNKGPDAKDYLIECANMINISYLKDKQF